MFYQRRKAKKDTTPIGSFMSLGVETTSIIDVETALKMLSWSKIVSNDVNVNYKISSAYFSSEKELHDIVPACYRIFQSLTFTLDI